jgi:hypothetical protein
MSDEMPQSPTPSMQPVSMHEQHGHSHGSLHLIVGLLGVLLVLETIVFGYVIMQYVDMKNEQAAAEEETDVTPVGDDEVETWTLNGQPHVFARANPGPRVNEIVMLDDNDRLTVVYTAEGVMSIDEVMVPQTRFDGRIFFTLLGEGDLPSLLLQELDISESGHEPLKPDFVDDLPFTGRSATAFSPDQSHIAALYYNPDFEETSGEVVMWSLLTGERRVVGQLNEGEAFTPTIHGFAGADGFDLSWQDSNCVVTPVYALSATGNDNTFIENREFCRE